MLFIHVIIAYYTFAIVGLLFSFKECLLFLNRLKEWCALSGFGKEYFGREGGSLCKASKGTTRFDSHYFHFSFLFTFYAFASTAFLGLGVMKSKKRVLWLDSLWLHAWVWLQGRRFGTVFIVKRHFCSVLKRTKLDRCIFSSRVNRVHIFLLPVIYTQRFWLLLPTVYALNASA